MASQHKTIIDALKTAIEAGLTGEPTIVIREQMYKLKTDTLPMIVLTMGVERQGPHTMGGSEFREYEIIVTTIYASNQQLETTIDDAKSIREDIRELVTVGPSTSLPLLSITGLWDCTAVDLPADNPSVFEAGYEEARLGLIYRSNEAT